MSITNIFVSHESQMFSASDGKVTSDEIRVPAFLPDTDEVRSDFAKYYNIVEAMDAQVGAHLAELDEAGLSDDTIVFYYSDHGGVLPRSKRYCYDDGLRAALIVHIPEKWRHLAPAAAGTKIEKPVSFVDLASTVLAIAQLERPDTMQGKAFIGRYEDTTNNYAFGMRNRMDE